ncbi:bactericidal permeability-increasing protein-like [Erythrolamprus reginae]|uniref:bactericidal permeability-increasing protein-like n=1 Tax=Erythrolamprus reginae TaxID=121349 RepID=UPI00396CCDA9
MSNQHLTIMLWLLFLPFFEPRLLFKEERMPPGALKLQINQRGLVYAKDVLMQMILPQLRKEPIKYHSSRYYLPPLGEVSISFSDTKIQQLQMNDSVASFDEGTGVRLTIRNAQIVLSTNWKLKHLFGQDNGTVQVDITSFSLSVLLGLDVDTLGRPLVQSISCSADIMGFELKFSGPNSQLYNWMAQGLKRTLISDLKQEVCREVKEAVDDFSLNLRKTEIWAQIDSIAGLDYSLVSKPEITEDQCSLDFKGEFFLMEPYKRRPHIVPTPILLPNRSHSMVVVGISDSLVNSAAAVYFAGNVLRVNFTDKKLSKKIPFRLTTPYVGALFPELSRQFPEMPMELQLSAQKAPQLHFHPGGLDVSLLGRAEAFVVLPNSSRVPVFTLGLNCNLTAQIFLKGVQSGNSFARVGGSVVLKGLRLSQEWSGIGEIKLSPLENLLNIAGPVVLSNQNRKLRAGKLLPNFFGASLVGPEVSMHEGFVLIKTDLQLDLTYSVL